MEKKKNKKKLIKKLKNKYRLVLMNDSSFDERISVLLTPMNVIAVVAAIFFFIAGITVSLIIFTPLKEYVPGYADSRMRINAFNAAMKADSLEHSQALYAQYFNNLQNVLNGNVSADTTAIADETPVQYEHLDFAISKEDSLLRAQIEEEEEYSIAFDVENRNLNTGMPGVFFFTPIRGTVTASYNAKTDHLGVDIAAKDGEAIKAVLEGTVILSSFTSDGGNVIQLQHSNNLVSVYKHNSALLKKVGDKVKAGTSIAIIGNSGEYTDGPHLHFELWYNGQAMDPQEFIVFN